MLQPICNSVSNAEGGSVTITHCSANYIMVQKCHWGGPWTFHTNLPGRHGYKTRTWFTHSTAHFQRWGKKKNKSNIIQLIFWMTEWRIWRGVLPPYLNNITAGALRYSTRAWQLPQICVQYTSKVAEERLNIPLYYVRGFDVNITKLPINWVIVRSNLRYDIVTVGRWRQRKLPAWLEQRPMEKENYVYVVNCSKLSTRVCKQKISTQSFDHGGSVEEWPLTNDNSKHYRQLHHLSQQYWLVE